MIFEARVEVPVGSQIFYQITKGLNLPTTHLSFTLCPDLRLPPGDLKPEERSYWLLEDGLYKSFLPTARQHWVFNQAQNRFILTTTKDRLEDLNLYLQDDPYLDLQVNHLNKRGHKPEVQTYQAIFSDGLMALKRKLRDLIERDGYRIDEGYITIPDSSGQNFDPEICFRRGGLLLNTGPHINQEFHGWVKSVEEQFNLELTTRQVEE